MEKVSRAQSETACRVARANILLAVDEGCSYADAARRIGRRSGEAVSHLAARFNQVGVAALNPIHGGGPATRYGATQRTKILSVLREQPDRLQDGTATWSLSTLQRRLRSTDPELATISTYTLHKVLRESGWSWQHHKSWCETGKVVRQRKAGLATVIDPDTEAKKP